MFFFLWKLEGREWMNNISHRRTNYMYEVGTFAWRARLISLYFTRHSRADRVGISPPISFHRSRWSCTALCSINAFSNWWCSSWVQRKGAAGAGTVVSGSAEEDVGGTGGAGGAGGAEGAGGAGDFVSDCLIREETFVSAGSNSDSDVGLDNRSDFGSDAVFADFVFLALGVTREEAFFKICEGTGWCDVDDDLGAFDCRAAWDERSSRRCWYLARHWAELFPLTCLEMPFQNKIRYSSLRRELIKSVWEDWTTRASSSCDCWETDQSSFSNFLLLVFWLLRPRLVARLI